MYSLLYVSNKSIKLLLIFLQKIMIKLWWQSDVARQEGNNPLEYRQVEAGGQACRGSQDTAVGTRPEMHSIHVKRTAGDNSPGHRQAKVSGQERRGSQGTVGMRPEVYTIHFRRAVARWSRGLDWGCRISNSLCTLGTWLRQTTPRCIYCDRPCSRSGVGARRRGEGNTAHRK